MSEILRDSIKQKKNKIKELLIRLHKGEKFEKLKKEFIDEFKSITPAEIAVIEQELIKEGFSRDEIMKMCDIHIEMFKESLQNAVDEINLPEWHPVKILMSEHKFIFEYTQKIKTENKINKLEEFVRKFQNFEKHYVREENVLFPFLEKYDLVEPPKIMWMEHDKIRSIKKQIIDTFENLKQNFNNENLKKFQGLISLLGEIIYSHYFKENEILFPTALKLLKQNDWVEIFKEFENIGWCCFIPPERPHLLKSKDKGEKRYVSESGSLKLSNGALTVEEIDSILNTLPFDITFVDKNDQVKYFNQASDRIFPRTKAVLGRKVQNCHPQKSIHIVNKILEDFKKGKRDVAEFWINYKGKFVYIRYFPVKNSKGEYIGTIEVTQDVTRIRKLEGEKRLLDD